MNTREENKAIQAAQRKRYMDHGDPMDHREYYLWLADFIGLTRRVVQVSHERVAASVDPHLNDIPLQTWDNHDWIFRQAANRKGIPWSLSDTVCTAKVLARNALSEGVQS